MATQADGRAIGSDGRAGIVNTNADSHCNDSVAPLRRRDRVRGTRKSGSYSRIDREEQALNQPTRKRPKNVERSNLYAVYEYERYAERVYVWAADPDSAIRIARDLYQGRLMNDVVTAYVKTRYA